MARYLVVMAALMMAIGAASALNYDQTARDAYSFEELENVNVSRYNSTGSYQESRITAADGAAEFHGLANDTHTFISRKGLYNDYSKTVNLTGDYAFVAYMTHASESYVKMKYADATFGEKKLCLYGEEGRLRGCYGVNDTIHLSEGNYSAYLQDGAAGAAADTGSWSSYLFRILPVVIVAGLLMAGFTTAAAIGWRTLRK